jgi:pimeloyl-ACP methyl ester carboxylesterase
MAGINAVVTGTGNPVVLLHGFCEDHTLWHDLAGHLSPRNKVIQLDLPGFGKSDLLSNGFSLKDIARIIHKYMSTQGFTRYAVIGHSLGGYIALSMAHQYPDSIHSTGLIHSTALADSTEKKANRNKAISFIEKHGTALFLEQFVPSLFYHKNREKLDREIQRVALMSKHVSSATITGYMSAMRDRPDHTDLLQVNNHNVLFVYGEKDALFTKIDITRQIKLIQNKHHVLCLKNTGHMGMYEASEQLQAKISEFLNQQFS